MLSARFRQAFAAQLLCAASATLAADNPAMWRVEPMTRSTAQGIKLLKGPQKTELGSVSTARLRILMDVKTRIEQQAGIAAELVLMEGAQPNAFSTPTSKTGPLVGINLGMMELVGDDRDAYAAVLGHEYAHLTLKHREARMGREGLRQAGTVVLSLILAAKGVNYGAGDIANLATSAISMTFSREEERDADARQYHGAVPLQPSGVYRTRGKHEGARRGREDPQRGLRGDGRQDHRQGSAGGRKDHAARRRHAGHVLRQGGTGVETREPRQLPRAFRRLRVHRRARG
jgi:hypothetical protein